MNPAMKTIRGHQNLIRQSLIPKTTMKSIQAHHQSKGFFYELQDRLKSLESLSQKKGDQGGEATLVELYLLNF